MRWRLNAAAALAFFLLLLAGGPGRAAPPPAAPAPTTPATTAPATTAPAPDYGGRDGGAVPLGAGADAPDPAASAGRALGALALVLAGVGGAVYALKRFGLVQPGADGRPARISFAGSGLAAPAQPAAGPSSVVTVEASRTLPGGATLHLVSVRGRTLLLGATAQSVQTLTEWRGDLDGADGDGDGEAEAFENYLARADAAPADPASPLSAANARLRSLLHRRTDGHTDENA